ncbi:MAG: hypothetical protein IPJ81_00575 [Chitinophagaceae bacterium]|nr:hypothetical protein [Chitinophagaceae bacterium]
MIELTLIIALVVLFIHVTTWEGMINEWVGRVFWDAPSWLKKTFVRLPNLYGSLRGALIIIIGEWFGAWPCYGFFKEIIMLFAAGGINTVLIYIISSDKEEIKALKDDPDA